MPSLLPTPWGRHPLKADSPEWGPLWLSWRPCHPACRPCASHQPCLQGPGHSIGMQPRPVPVTQGQLWSTSCACGGKPAQSMRQCHRQALLQCTCGLAGPALTGELASHMTSRALLQPGSCWGLQTGRQHYLFPFCTTFCSVRQPSDHKLHNRCQAGQTCGQAAKTWSP